LGYSNTIIILAIKDINEGDELVFDYGMSETNFEPWACTCGVEGCRKTIRPDDWKNEELRSKYGEYFAGYLRGKF